MLLYRQEEEDASIRVSYSYKSTRNCRGRRKRKDERWSRAMGSRSKQRACS